MVAPACAGAEYARAVGHGRLNSSPCERAPQTRGALVYTEAKASHPPNLSRSRDSWTWVIPALPRHCGSKYVQLSRLRQVNRHDARLYRLQQTRRKLARDAFVAILANAHRSGNDWDLAQSAYDLADTFLAKTAQQEGITEVTE